MPPLRGEDSLPLSNPHLRLSGLWPSHPGAACPSAFAFPCGSARSSALRCQAQPRRGELLSLTAWFGLGRGGDAFSVPAMKLLNVNARSFTALSLKSCKASTSRALTQSRSVFSMVSRPDSRVNPYRLTLNEALNLIGGTLNKALSLIGRWRRSIRLRSLG